MKSLAIVIGLACAAVAQPSAEDTATVIAWKNGWIAYSIDALAIDEYHRRADQLVDDTDHSALMAIWGDVVRQSKDTESQWDTLSDSAKYNYPVSPFWKRDVGLPRRISKGWLK